MCLFMVIICCMVLSSEASTKHCPRSSSSCFCPGVSMSMMIFARTLLGWSVISCTIVENVLSTMLSLALID